MNTQMQEIDVDTFNHLIEIFYLIFILSTPTSHKFLEISTFARVPHILYYTHFSIFHAMLFLILNETYFIRKLAWNLMEPDRLSMLVSYTIENHVYVIG